MYDVVKRYDKVSSDLIDAYRKIGESATIYESLPLKNGAITSIKPVWRGARVCGRALTVSCPASDNLMLHKAISMAGPHDVIVVVAEGHSKAGGMFGGMMAASLQRQGAAGIILECACRDTGFIEEIRLPVFSRTVNVRATTKKLPGKINHPVILDGVLIHPGDLLFGDDDGVVVIPREEAEKVLIAARQREENETAMLKKIRNGEIITFDIFKQDYERLGLSEEQ